MRDLTPQPNPDQRQGDDTRVEDAVNAILRRLKRGYPVRLPGLGSLLPGAPPSFRSIREKKPAPPKATREARNVKR